MIFPSAVPHHLDTVILSIACQCLSLQQYYLYPEGLTGTYLLISQNGNIKTRKIIRNISRSVDFEPIKQNLKRYQPPTWASQVETYKKNFYFSFFYILIRRTASRTLKFLKIVRNKSDDLDALFGISGRHIFPLVKSMMNQRRYLKLYSKCSDHKYYEKKSKKNFVIYANYQPEATTAPEGLDYYSTLKIAMEIRSQFPEAQIFYKEHPASEMYVEDFIVETRIGYCRSTRYLSELQEMGCIFIPTKTNQSDFHNLWMV